MPTYCHLHTALWISDLARAEHFYGTVLGIPKVERLPFNFPGAWYQVGSSQIHLILAEKPVDQRHTDSKWGRNPHLALGVEDLEGIKARLLQQGYEIQSSASGRAALFVRDPDGNVIELSSASAKELSSASAKELSSANAKENPEGQNSNARQS
ncbi:MAG: VOC family protein [Thermostichus sp. DG02_4_bins_136]